MVKKKDIKRYSVEKWLDFQMVDEKSVLIKSMSLKILFMI
jgi:protein tyrosine phosphatase